MVPSQQIPWYYDFFFLFFSAVSIYWLSSYSFFSLPVTFSSLPFLDTRKPAATRFFLTFKDASFILSLQFPFQVVGKAKFTMTGVLTQVTGTTCSCGRRLSYTKYPQNCSCELSIFSQHVPRYIPAITQKGRGLQRKQTSKDQWFVKQWHRGVTVTSGAESNSSLYRKL